MQQRIDRSRPARRLLLHLLQRLQKRGGCKRWLARETFVEHRAKAVNVGRAARRITRRLLRRHVSRRARNLCFWGQARLDSIFARLTENLGQAEIRETWLALSVDEDIGGFQVAMKNPAQV